MNDADLTKWVVKWRAKSLAYVELRLVADQLVEDQKSYLDALQNAIADGAKEPITEARLLRMARGSKEFRDYINRMCLAKAAAYKAKVEADALEKMFEAERSQLSYEKEGFKKGVFDKMGGR